MNKNCTKGKVAQARRMLERVPHWLLSAVCLLVILWLTLVPDPLGDTELPLFPGADKVVHGLMFFGLTLCFLIDLKRSRGWKKLGLPQISFATIVGMLIGIGIEFLQPEVGRSFEFWDMGADAFGAVFAGTLWTLVDGILTIDDKMEERENQR